jgi:hypothetical protein
LLVRAEGGLRIRHFPNPSGASVVEDLQFALERRTSGFATVAAVFLGFDGPLDPASVPSDPRRALDPGAPIQLLDVDPRSPERGRRFPLALRYGAEATTHLPPHHLAARVPFGLTLRPGTTYALVVLDGLRGAEGAAVAAPPGLRASVDAACGPPEAPWAAWLGPLRAAGPDLGLDPARVVGATRFTTQDAPETLRDFAALAGAQAPVPPEAWTRDAPSPVAAHFSGEGRLPSFQEGFAPFLRPEDGGALARDADGAPRVAGEERVRVSVAVPRGRRAPAAGWPVVLYAHGTGGSFASARNPAVADTLARRGVAVVGFDLSLHGPRDPSGGSPDVTFFNLGNPVAARDNVRQGALDLFGMRRMLDAIEVPPSVTGAEPIRFDPDRVAMVGHSQGALGLAPALAASLEVEAAVLSGLGAVLTVTLLERKNPADFAALTRALLDLPEEEPLDAFHPALHLLQTFIEPADPIAYARDLFDRPESGPRADLLMFEGLLDFASPARGQEAFAVAAGLPLIHPVARAPAAAAFRPLPVAAPPVSENRPVPGGAVTAGLLQYAEEDHFPLFRNTDANRRFARFIETALVDPPARVVGPAR